MLQSIEIYPWKQEIRPQPHALEEYASHCLGTRENASNLPAATLCVYVALYLHRFVFKFLRWKNREPPHFVQ